MSCDLREGILLGFGHPLLDIIADVEDEFLDKYNLKPDNVILATTGHRSLYKELVAKYPVKYIAGGATQNTIRVAQWVLKTPRYAAFIGTIGSDKFGQLMANRAKGEEIDAIIDTFNPFASVEDGVDVDGYIVDQTTKTGTCAVLVSGNGLNRSMCTFLGASKNFQKEHMIQKWALVKKARLYYTAGFTISTSFESVQELAEHSFRKGKVLTFNLSAPYICEKYSERVLQLLPYIDVLFGNESEGLALAKAFNWKTEDLSEIVSRLVSEIPTKKQERMVVMTQGQGHVLVAKTGKPLLAYPVPHIPTKDIVDTNGAGDAFVGGFLGQYAQQKPLNVCLKTGIFCAQQIIRVSGCMLPGDEFNENDLKE